MKKMKKLMAMALSLALCATLGTTAFAAAPMEDASYSDAWAEASDVETVEPGVDEPAEPTMWGESMGQTGIFGMPFTDGSHRTRSWLADQIRLKPIYTNSYPDGELHTCLRLSNATKIIFVVNKLYPKEYAHYYGDELLEYWYSIPCGLNARYYNYLATVEKMAQRCGSDGVDGLMAHYSDDELAEMYQELKTAAMPYESELIQWLEDFSIMLELPTCVVESSQP